MLFVTPFLRIPPGELELTYVRSSGPGGQNVNKVNSKAVLRWNLQASPSVLEWMRAKLIERLGPKLTRAGEIILTSDRYRDQLQNREDCLDKLRALLVQALAEAKPRKETRPTRSSRRRTLNAKGQQSRKKALRQRPRNDD
jgi:ribosome-associated protein